MKEIGEKNEVANNKANGNGSSTGNGKGAATRNGGGSGNGRVRNNGGSSIDPRKLTLAALMAAVLCIVGPATIPIGPVPLSLAVFVVCLAAMLLGRLSALSCLIYLLIGLCGLPVFSGYAGGPAKLLGPTGGYLIGYVFMAAIAGYFIDRFPGSIRINALGMVLGLMVCYLFGTAWLAVSAHMGFAQALLAGVIPFIAFDLAKIAFAIGIGALMRQRLGQMLYAPA